MVEENKPMNSGEDLGGFLIVCPDCQKENKQHNTILYIDWENELYTIQCQMCSKIVYFDFYGRQIPPKMVNGLVKNRQFVN